MIHLIVENRILSAFVVIAILTAILVVTNTHRAVLQFIEDRNAGRLCVFLGAILLMGGLILNTSYRLFSQVIETSVTGGSNTALIDL